MIYKKFSQTHKKRIIDGGKKCERSQYTCIFIYIYIYSTIFQTYKY
jgi:hypothetical protein